MPFAVLSQRQLAFSALDASANVSLGREENGCNLRDKEKGINVYRDVATERLNEELDRTNGRRDTWADRCARTLIINRPIDKGSKHAENFFIAAAAAAALFPDISLVKAVN